MNAHPQCGPAPEPDLTQGEFLQDTGKILIWAQRAAIQAKADEREHLARTLRDIAEEAEGLAERLEAEEHHRLPSAYGSRAEARADALRIVREAEGGAA